MKRKLVTISVIASLFLASCGGGESSADGSGAGTEAAAATTASYDLTEKGIPTVIEGPSGANIGKGMSGGEIDGVKTTSLSLTVDKFKMEINMDSEPSGRTLPELIQFYKEISQDDEGFEVVKEDANGFIYKSTLDGAVNYQFHFIKMNESGSALEMTTAFSISDYTLEEVEKMYEAAKTATWK